MLISLTKVQLEHLVSVTGGATIWGLNEAKIYREIQKQDPQLLTFVGLDELEKIHSRSEIT
ncbi:hypothetical protein [Shouchella miscanthi]|uniref:hypothetical protein n=1 Tax=Shouchella miscanthi TaxID=2598861 RepID=UPI0011A52B10|nr:hypothetical protein [Shouchella miscanthi]